MVGSSLFHFLHILLVRDVAEKGPIMATANSPAVVAVFLLSGQQNIDADASIFLQVVYFGRKSV